MKQYFLLAVLFLFTTRVSLFAQDIVGPDLPAMGIIIPVFTFESDVRVYMRDVIYAPPLEGYKLPVEYEAVRTYDDAVLLYGNRYPEFEGLEGAELVQAVWIYPARYQGLILEASAVRDRFFPGWREQRLPGGE